MNGNEHQPLIIMRAPNNHINVTSPGRISITVPVSDCSLKVNIAGEFAFSYGESIQILHLSTEEVSQLRACGVAVDASALTGST